MKNTIILSFLLILSQLGWTKNYSKDYFNPKKIHFGLGGAYKGILGIEANLFNQVDIISNEKNKVKFSVLSEVGIGATYLGFAAMGSFQSFAKAQFKRISLGYGYSSHQIWGSSNKFNINGWNTYRVGYNYKDGKDNIESYLSFQPFHGNRSYVTIEIGVLINFNL